MSATKDEEFFVYDPYVNVMTGHHYRCETCRRWVFESTYCTCGHPTYLHRWDLSSVRSGKLPACQETCSCKALEVVKIMPRGKRFADLVGQQVEVYDKDGTNLVARGEVLAVHTLPMLEIRNGDGSSTFKPAYLPRKEQRVEERMVNFPESQLPLE